MGGSEGIDLDRCVEMMARQLRHRGPDRLSTWVATDGQVAFGHTRLAVVDVSPAGDQPMTSSDGRWTITYNGEIYNSGSLLTDLKTPHSGFRGHSDTEIFLECVTAWGVRKTLERAVGMFAFAIWDNERSQLWLARDRFG
ncbi:MAG: asparagine synthetase B, partial [Rhodospirillaceae bacterium]|nr:asparagine synthetase B [Rhodospirillaceae bacterium]